MLRTVMPEGAQIHLNGTFYKIWRRGLVMRWTGTEWVKSSNSKKELKNKLFGVAA